MSSSQQICPICNVWKGCSLATTRGMTSRVPICAGAMKGVRIILLGVQGMEKMSPVGGKPLGMTHLRRLRSRRPFSVVLEALFKTRTSNLMAFTMAGHTSKGMEGAMGVQTSRVYLLTRSGTPLGWAIAMCPVPLCGHQQVQGYERSVTWRR